MKKQILLFILMLLPMIASADAVEINGIYYNIISKTKEAEVTSNPNKYSGDISIPESIQYEGTTYKVTSIGYEAFSRCVNLNSIKIPKSVITISDLAFFYCIKLTNVDIPNSVVSIGGSAFERCTVLTSISIPNSVTTIGIAAFSWCSGLTSIVLPSSIVNIENMAFYECRNLSSIEIPDGVEWIGHSVFWNCTSLKSLSIPNSVTHISAGLCRGCSSLATVEIGNNVEKVVNNAFTGCKELTDFYCYTKTVPKTSPDVFSESMIEYATLHVPSSSISLYQAADQWKNFKKIVKINMPEHTLTYKVDGQVYKTYSIEEGETITPEPAPTKEGYSFSGWSDIPQTMPDHDVTVTGSFTINKYKLTYKVDGSVYKTYDVEYGASITPEASPTKEGYTFSGWSEIPMTMPAKDVTVTGSFTVNKYKLIYKVDGMEYKSYDIEFGAKITPEAAPTKEGYTFSGWSQIPQTMPAKDVTVTGTFTINKYKLIYKVDGVEYKSFDMEYGSSITPEAEPTKEGYTFSGWSEIPKTMPAKDVTVTGSFTVNKYKLIYKVDGIEYKSYDIEFGAKITPEAAPTKEGYTFSGWSEIPETMPARDVTVTGTFSKGSFKVIYYVDGEVYKTISYDYGATITPEAEPTKEGYTFSGWSYIPSKMPAEDVTVTGTFTINKYKLIYKVDGEVYKSYEIEYGATITPEAEPTKEGYTFSGWSKIPQTMPAYDVTITGTFTKGSYKLIYKIDGEVYKTVSYDYGATITPEADPSKEGYTFSGWSEIPKTMPDHDVTVTGTFTINKYKLIYKVDGEVYKSYEIEYGATITPEAEPTKEGYKFSGWSYIPSKMPAEDVTVVGTFTQEAAVKDNVSYEIDGDNASVTHADNAKGEIKIEASVVINGKTYSVTAIADGAFQGCAGLTSVELPNTVTTIGKNAFDGCSGLIVIKIGKGIKEIGSKAFANIATNKIRTRAEDVELKVYCEAEVLPSTAADAFENTPIDKATLYVVDEMVTVYKFVMPWNGFGKILGFEEAAGINAIMIDSDRALIFDMQGNRLDNVRKGVNIIRTKDGKTKKMMVK